MRFFRLSFLLLSVVLCLPACDEKPRAKAPSAVKKTKSNVSPDAVLKDARVQILAGNFTEAAAALKEVQNEPDIRQPLLNWIAFHEGMAWMLAGQDKEANEVFGRVEDRGLFSQHPKDELEANFFVNVAHLLRGKDPISADVAKDYDRWTFEGIAFLLYALKDWNLGKFDDAVALFRQFQNANPEKMVEWADGPGELKQLQAMAEDCVNDYTAYQPAITALKEAKTPEQEAAAVETARAARAKMKLATKLSKEIDTILADLGPKVAAVMAEKDKMSAEEEAFDAKALPEAKQKRTELMGKFQFKEAKEAMLDPALKTEKARDEQQLLGKKSSWLANFKSQLIDDINKDGFTQPLKTKAGAALAGGAVKADEQQFLTPTPRGLVPVPWGDLAPESAFAMGQFFIKADMTPEIVSFRKWHLGVFGSYIGKQAESLTLMKEAAEVRTILKDEISIFEKPTSSW
jgi:hypothetical protein